MYFDKAKHLLDHPTNNAVASLDVAKVYALMAIVEHLDTLVGELSVLNTNIQNMDLNLSTVIERK